MLLLNPEGSMGVKTVKGRHSREDAARPGGLCCHPCSGPELAASFLPTPAVAKNSASSFCWPLGNAAP